jgi:hypothetical protein
MNIQNFADVTFGSGPGTLNSNLAKIQAILDALKIDGYDVGKLIGECLRAPQTEPVYPQDAN